MLLCLSVAGTSAGDLPEAYEGYTGVYEGFPLVHDDRFDTFDEKIWAKGDGAVGKESACRFQDEGVQLKDGILELNVTEADIPAGWSEDHQKEKTAYSFLCGEVRTRPERRILVPVRKFTAADKPIKIELKFIAE